MSARDLKEPDTAELFSEFVGPGLSMRPCGWCGMTWAIICETCNQEEMAQWVTILIMRSSFEEDLCRWFMSAQCGDVSQSLALLQDSVALQKRH